MELFSNLRHLLSYLGTCDNELTQYVVSLKSHCVAASSPVDHTFLNNTLVDAHSLQVLVKDLKKTVANDCGFDQVLTGFCDLMDCCNSRLIHVESLCDSAKRTGLYNGLDKISVSEINCIRPSTLGVLIQSQMPYVSPPIWNTSRTPTLADVGLTAEAFSQFTAKQELIRNSGFPCLISKEACESKCFEDLVKKQCNTKAVLPTHPTTNLHPLMTTGDVVDKGIVLNDFSECMDLHGSKSVSSIITDLSIPTAPILSHVTNMILQGGSI